MTGSELRKKRTAMELSQTALAKLLGVRQATVSGWETGKRSIAHPIDLAMKEVERQQKKRKGNQR